MKSFLPFCFIYLVALTATAQPNPAGIWEGKLNVGTTSLRIVLHLTKTADGYTTTIDSPDQGATGIKTTSTTVKGDSVVVETAAIRGQFAGRLLNDSTLDGKWMQGLSLPLTLKRVKAVATLKRPQTPQPPFGYASNDVLFQNKDKSIQYGATITIPHKKMGPLPAAILISGSGQQNRDEELFGHKPFAVIADYLTKRGYVVLRIDDRGVGGSTGPLQGATSKDFAEDVKAAMEYLKVYPGVDGKRIGLIGHSEGGMIAQLVAAERDDVAFVVSLAGPGQRIDELMVDQNKAVMKTAGIDSTAINAYAAFYKSVLLAVTTAASDAEAKTAVRQALRSWISRTPTATVALTTGIRDSIDAETVVQEMTDGLRSPWFRYFLQYDPAPYIKKMKARVLVLNGEKDVQVVAKPNIDGWRKALVRSGSKHWMVKELKGLNHLFQTCTTCTVAEYGQLEETFSVVALGVMGDWLDKQLR